jgi:ABC-type uncharacterized transport system auxiliary subunit
MSVAMSMPRSLTALILGAALLAAGCSGVFARQPLEKQRFVLAPGKPDPVSGPRAGVLRVGVVHASTPFQNRGFVHRTGDESFKSDFYNEFAAPPGILLRDVLALWLRDGTHFETVVQGSEAPTDWLLEVDLESLYADLRDAAAPQVAIGITVRLLDAHAAGAAIAFQKHYAVSEPAADASPSALAAAWNRALARVLGELAVDLDAARARRASRSRSR